MQTESTFKNILHGIYPMVRLFLTMIALGFIIFHTRHALNLQRQSKIQILCLSHSIQVTSKKHFQDLSMTSNLSRFQGISKIHQKTDYI